MYEFDNNINKFYNNRHLKGLYNMNKFSNIKTREIDKVIDNAENKSKKVINSVEKVERETNKSIKTASKIIKCRRAFSIAADVLASIGISIVGINGFAEHDKVLASISMLFAAYLAFNAIDHIDGLRQEDLEISINKEKIEALKELKKDVMAGESKYDKFNEDSINYIVNARAINEVDEFNLKK